MFEYYAGHLILTGYRHPVFTGRRLLRPVFLPLLHSQTRPTTAQVNPAASDDAPERPIRNSILDHLSSLALNNMKGPQNRPENMDSDVWTFAKLHHPLSVALNNMNDRQKKSESTDRDAWAFVKKQRKQKGCRGKNKIRCIMWMLPLITIRSKIK